MLSSFKKYTDAKMSFLKGKPLLVACSGGVDSVVLAHLCVKAGFQAALAHCNFNLRGSESDGDEVFVKDLAKELGIACFVKRFNTEQYAKSERISIQMAARELRYQWFDEILDAKGYDYLLTAHHADDNLETFLINLSRGTGIDGLSGIPIINGKVVRPLLNFSQDGIMAYAHNEDLHWREDSSNAEHKYLRNKIRHEIVPKLKELHPTFLQNFLNTQNNLEQTKDLATNHLNEIKSQLFLQRNGDIQICITELEKLKPMDAYLYGLFKDYGFTEWSDVRGLLGAMSGKEVFSKTHRLLKDRDCVLLSKIKNRVHEEYTVYLSDTVLGFPIRLTVESVLAVEKTDKNSIYLDKEKLNFPLVLRNWEKGDYFYPFGMKGKKKLSKFFKDEKVDVLSKEKQWLLCSNDDIVWVVGKRADERFKVDASTKHILKITQIT